MNESITRLMDLSALAGSVIAALFLTIVYRRKAKGNLSSVPLFFMILGPLAIAVHMVMHLVGIGYVASLKIGAGTFIYDFRFYSLALLSGILGYLSYNLFQQSTSFFLQPQPSRGAWVRTCILIVLVSAPTIPFTFIGSLPVLAVALNLVAAFFVRKKSKKEAGIAQPLTGALLSQEAIAG